MEKKCYVIIGGSSGIGLAMARQLASDAHTVFVGSRTPGPLEKLPGITHFAYDALTDTPPKEVVPKQIDGLAYCPGTIRLKPLRALKDDDFLEDFRLNLLGAARSIRHFMTPLRKAPTGGSIVLFSTVAVKTGMPYHASIASAKGAVEGLVRSLAAELAPRIRVNAVAPSLTETPLAEALLDNESKRSAAAGRHPLQRIGTPDEIAATACHLLGDSSGWITGQIVRVDGGMGALRTFK